MGLLYSLWGIYRRALKLLYPFKLFKSTWLLWQKLLLLYSVSLLAWHFGEINTSQLIGPNCQWASQCCIVAPETPGNLHRVLQAVDVCCQSCLVYSKFHFNVIIYLGHKITYWSLLSRICVTVVVNSFDVTYSQVGISHSLVVHLTPVCQGL